MKYVALIAVVAVVVSIPLAAGLALAASPAANTLSLDPQDDSGCGSMHRNGNGPQYQNLENLGEGAMCHDWERNWDYNYSHNYSYGNCPCMG